MQWMGFVSEGLSHYEQALAMRQKLTGVEVSDGHSDLAASINNLSAILHGDGSYEKALPFCEQ